MKKNAGFTLLEIILTVACLGLISLISIPVYQSFQNRNDLSLATSATVQSLRRAQLLSQAAENDTSSGVKIQSGSLVIFRGSSYALRDASLDEITDISTSISPSGLSEIIFTKTFGLPLATGSIILSSNINETKTITINEKGLLDY